MDVAEATVDALHALQRLDDGQLLVRLVDMLSEVSAEVVMSGKPGSVTLQLKVSNNGQGDVMTIVTPTLKRTAPPPPELHGTLFFTINGELLDRDPRQQRLPGEWGTVETTREVRTADDPVRVTRES
jgi:hypothetical protein